MDAIYEAVDGNDDEWHNAVLLVETHSVKFLNKKDFSLI